MSPEMDKFDQFDESIVSKLNRRRKLEPKSHTPLVGPMPPTGVHKLSRKDSERLKKERLEKFIKKSV